jgi:hypothetical protein
VQTHPPSWHPEEETMHNNRNSLSSFGTVITFGVLLLTQVVVAQNTSQTPNRLSDKDLQSLMSNLKTDAKAFRPRFDSAVKKSSIRKTSQAKDAMNLASTFEKQTSTALNEFKKTKKGDAVPAMLSTAGQIEKFMTDLKLDPQATGWDKIRTDLNQVSNAFGIASPAAAAGEDQNTIPCVQAVGAGRSKKLVEECLQVSPATHPPCNSQNSCQLIISEIKRSCSLLQKNQPSFCTEYK